MVFRHLWVQFSWWWSFTFDIDYWQKAGWELILVAWSLISFYRQRSFYVQERNPPKVYDTGTRRKHAKGESICHQSSHDHYTSTDYYGRNVIGRSTCHDPLWDLRQRIERLLLGILDVTLGLRHVRCYPFDRGKYMEPETIWLHDKYSAGGTGGNLALSSAPLFLAKLPVGLLSLILRQKYCPETLEEGEVWHRKTMWLIIGFSTILSPIFITLLWGYLSGVSNSRDNDGDQLLVNGNDRPTIGGGAIPQMKLHRVFCHWLTLL
jgi:hypothetical protein